MATKDTNYLVAVHKGLDESLEKQVAALPEKFDKLISQNAKHRPLCEHS